MKSVVTGGAGFIGSHLVYQLVKMRHHVTVIDNLSAGHLSNLHLVKNKIEFVNVDITSDKKYFEKYFSNTDWVFHMAGLADLIPSIINPQNYFQCNVMGTLNVLEVSRKTRVKKFIYAASASCYGIPKNFPTDEKSTINPMYPYALTKFLGEQLTINWAKIYKMHNVSLRLFNAYGLRSSIRGAYGSIFGIFLAQKLAGKPLTIVGDGNQTRDFVHVYDLVDAMIKAVQKGKNGEIYNVGSEQETSVNLIAKLIGGDKLNIPKRPGETERSLAEITKIKNQINWKPLISVEEGIDTMLKNINDWKEAKIWTLEKILEENKKLTFSK